MVEYPEKENQENTLEEVFILNKLLMIIMIINASN
ncbi:unnamed protein product [Paramecium pentaurelia]|uniref:Uncharacterized protein n=1 Tax=Paramecium pentaurelia TaxID=43138 RepID=A0A8S1X4S2_9CILI|nr:unnamed protein product [Paramecium pentaurelia]